MCSFISRNKNLFEKLDIIIDSCENNDKSLINILHHAQGIFGYLPNEVQIYISEKLNITPDKVSSVVNFYSYFTTELKGKFKISVCLGVACSKNGTRQVLDEFEKKLGINSGETTDDLKFSLDSTRCFGLCRVTPVISVNGKIYDGVTPEDVVSILNEYN